MPRLLVHVEGQTELAFVHGLLSAHLTRFGYSAVSARLLGNPRLRSRRGGIRSWQSCRMDVIRHIKEDRGAIAATMVDYYALPHDWPGRTEAATKRSTSEKAEHVEKALIRDVSDQLGDAFDKRRFLPLVVMHEFEALLFSDPQRFAEGINMGHLAEALKSIRAEFESPEDIDDSPETAPSKRLMRLLPAYEKPLFGLIGATAIGLEVMRLHCDLPPFSAR